MKVFGIDPGSARTGYGCVASDGSRHRSLAYGVIAAPAGAALPEKLHGIHRSLAALLARHRPDCVVIENIFHASALHDIGKVGIPDGILLKPGPLDQAEFHTMKQHAQLGALPRPARLTYDR